MINRFIQVTLGESTTTTTAICGGEQDKKDIMLIIIYSNNHPTQCYPRIRLRNPSNCDDLMINPAITDANTSIIETHYDRLAAVAQHQGLDSQ